MGTHVTYGITQCYLPPSRASCSWYSILRHRMDARLSWPSRISYISRWYTFPKVVTHLSTTAFNTANFIQATTDATIKKMVTIIKYVIFISSPSMISHHQRQSMNHTQVSVNRKWFVAQAEQNQRLGPEDLQRDTTAASHRKPDTQAEIATWQPLCAS